VQPRLGSNGAAKSTLWDALSWVLYGRTVAGLRNPDVRPWRGGGVAVAVRFRLDAAAHEIVRTAFPNRLALDGRVVAQPDIDRLLGLSFEVFRNTILLGQGRPLFLDCSPADKLALLADVLDLARWEQRSQHAAERTRALEAERAASRATLQATEAQIGQAKTMRAALTAQQEEWEREYAAARDQRRQQAAALAATLDRLQRERDTADLAYDSAGTELAHLAREQSELAIYRDMQRGLVADRLAHNRTIERQIAALRANAPCPTCGHRIAASALAGHQAELRAQLRPADTAADSALADLERQLAANAAHRTRFAAKAEAARETMLRLDPQLAEANARLGLLRQQDAQQTNPHSAAVAALMDQLERLRRQRAELKLAIETQAARTGRTQFWVKGFRELRLAIVEETLAAIALMANGMMAELGLAGWALQLAVERESASGTSVRAITAEVRAPGHPDPVRWESWSGGEGQRLRLITALALGDCLLAQAGITTSLRILDEPTRHLSAPGSEDLVALLAERARIARQQVWFTDHHVLESSQFASVLTVRKDAAGARIA